MSLKLIVAHRCKVEQMYRCIGFWTSSIYKRHPIIVIKGTTIRCIYLGHMHFYSRLWSNVVQTHYSIRNFEWWQSKDVIQPIQSWITKNKKSCNDCLHWYNIFCVILLKGDISDADVYSLAGDEMTMTLWTQTFIDCLIDRWSNNPQKIIICIGA